MTTPTNPPIFDGHNDTVLELTSTDPSIVRDFMEEAERGHLDLPRARKGGMGGGFFAMFPRSPQSPQSPLSSWQGVDPEQMPATPAPLDQSYALGATMRSAAALLKLEARSEGQIKVVRTAAELQACMDNGTFAMLLHIEDAAPIDADFDALHVLYAMGLRSLGIVWSRPNIFGFGVPFKFPSSPDTGPGLTDYGKGLVRECNKLGVMVDLSHMNEKGFWDVAGITDAPLVATHSNAHTLSTSPRNLTDKQLDALAESGGVVGMNYHVGFLREDGDFHGETSLAEIARHAAYIAERIGAEHVALGSDFDGATMPQDLRDAAGLPKLMDALREYGFSEEELVGIAHGNWVRVLKETWGE